MLRAAVRRLPSMSASPGRTVRAAVPGAGTLVPYCMPGPLSVEIRYKRMEDAARAALTDRNGHPFAQPDPFTRSGVVDGVSALF